MPHFIETTIKLTVPVADLSPARIGDASDKITDAVGAAQQLGIMVAIEKPERVVTRRQKAASEVRETDDAQKGGGEVEAPGAGSAPGAVGADPDAPLGIPAGLRRARV